ncbi:MAG: extracellular solute-binding protein [Chloroflexota bacterium]|nr:extracellular solute-binding protein [Chloroflexota bacterium]
MNLKHHSLMARLLVLVAVLSLVAAACVAPAAPPAQQAPAQEAEQPAPAEEAEPAAEPVTIRLWMHDHAPRVPIDEERIAQFMEENPDITVEYELVPDFFTALNTALASGEGPDVFNQFTPFNAQYYLEGILAAVDPAGWGFESVDEVKALYGEGEIADNLLAGATYDGGLYGVPTELSAYACFTNDDLWKEAGLDPATDFPTTWEEMVDVAEQLTVRDEDGNPIQRGFDFNWTAAMYMMLHFNPMVQQLGGNMIDDQNYAANINTPEVKKVLSYWNDWANEYNLGGPQYTASRDAFQAGELATECSFGNWGAPLIEDAGINYSIHPQLRWADGVNDSGFANFAFYLMVNSRADPAKQAAGWKLIAHLTGAPDRYLNEAGLFQPVASYVASDDFAANEIMPVFVDEINKSFFHPRFVGFNETIDSMGRMRDRVVIGGEDIDTVLAETEEEISEILARAKEDATGQ